MICTNQRSRPCQEWSDCRPELVIQAHLTSMADDPSLQEAAPPYIRQLSVWPVSKPYIISVTVTTFQFPYVLVVAFLIYQKTKTVWGVLSWSPLSSCYSRHVFYSEQPVPCNAISISSSVHMLQRFPWLVVLNVHCQNRPNTSNFLLEENNAMIPIRLDIHPYVSFLAKYLSRHICIVRHKHIFV